MAGNYDDAPSRRFAWDADGTVGLYVGVAGSSGVSAGANPPNALIEMNSTIVDDLNDEDPASTLTVNVANTYRSLYYALVFPEPRELDGIMVQSEGYVGAGTWTYCSATSTNGFDGTPWAQLVPDGSITNGTDAGDVRDEITSAALAARTAIRGFTRWRVVNHNPSLRSLHIYGVISPGETPDRILFLDTENSDAVFTKPLDYGEVPRGQTQVRTIKLKNNSASKAINTVQITAEDLYLNAGGWYTFGDDDVSYQATFSVGNLGPAGTQLIYVKQSVPDGETLGLQTGRIKVSHASLT